MLVRLRGWRPGHEHRQGVCRANPSTAPRGAQCTRTIHERGPEVAILGPTTPVFGRPPSPPKRGGDSAGPRRIRAPGMARPIHMARRRASRAHRGAQEIGLTGRETRFSTRLARNASAAERARSAPDVHFARRDPRPRRSAEHRAAHAPPRRGQATVSGAAVVRGDSRRRCRAAGKVAAVRDATLRHSAPKGPAAGLRRSGARTRSPKLAAGLWRTRPVSPSSAARRRPLPRARRSR